MLAIAYVTITILLFISGAIYLRVRNIAGSEAAVSNPTFVNFQKTYFRPYFLALFAEWLQGPYLYKLYSHYGFIDTQIAVIYVCGFASSVLFGTSTGYLADCLGRKKVCVLFTILYSVCCLTKLSREFGILIVSRILGGISTSLLFTSFDTWYIYEHTQVNDFPQEWVSLTFKRATLFNSFVAVSAGISANIVAEWFRFGPVSPFLLAIPFLISAGAMIQMNWEENYGNRNSKFFKPCFESLKHILTNRRVMLIGTITSLFESVMYIFVFLWTPVLDPAEPPLGIVFSCFMICVMIGSFLFDVLLKCEVSPVKTVIFAVITASISNIISAFASAMHPRTTFLAFLIIEISCGMYFPAMSWLRSRVIPEAHHAGIINWFRVPMNTIAGIVLLILHDTHSSHGITAIFSLCSILLGIAGIAAVRFMILTRDDESLMVEQGQSDNKQSARV